MKADSQTLLADLIARARRAGADQADAVLVAGTALSVQHRLGRIEQVEQADGRDLGLRVFVGQRAAIVSATSVDPAGFDQLAERAVAMARVVPNDPYGGLAETAVAPEAAALAALQLEDAAEPDVSALSARAAQAEEAALAVNGITNSEGAEASWVRVAFTLVTSAGLAWHHTRTSHSLSATALAGQGTGMQRDYEYARAVHLADLDDAAVIGRTAAERAAARLNPVRPRTMRVPVVYDPRVAGSLVNHLLSAINGGAIARGTSFLKEKLGQRLFAPGLAIHDDPRRVRGLSSKAYDGEGTPTAARALVEDGVLTTWLLDSRSARQLGLRSTGHAGRGTGGPPSPSSTNTYLAPGSVTPAELMAGIREGFYVTELIGMGVNGVTGDYSRGAAGFMIRDGALAEPVAEITIAGNLLAIFAAMVPANDLRFRRGTDAPTVRVDGLTLGGA